MEERSKTNKEIFNQKYPIKKVLNDPVVGAEAIGYLKALIQYFPCEKKWVDNKIAELWLIMFFPHYSKGGANMWEEFNTGIINTITEVMYIINDSLCYGFEFKVENHKLYFREAS